MLNSKRADIMCAAAIVFAVVLVVGFALFGERLGIQPASSQPAYMTRLFDDSRVHTVDIQMDSWDTMIAEASEDHYEPCTLIIDGETFEGAGLRVKGNNSRSLVSKYGLERYSFKVEFDHFKKGATYHGLDKLSLDASFQDNSYLKSYLIYDMMDYMGVPAPACSYTWITVNGEPWGLYMATEEPEEAFAKRHFGPNYGALYKPDYRSLEDPNTDVALQYVGDDFAYYDNIFRKALVDIDDADKRRLIEALLYEEDGRITMLPWDYNLAFATYTLGMPDAENNPLKYVNQPIDTPAEGEVMLNRPLYHNLMQYKDSFSRYYELYDEFIAGYFESGRYEVVIRKMERLIDPYVEKDPTAYCSYEDFHLGVDALVQFCDLRAQSVRGQLEGTVPSSYAEQEAGVGHLVDPGDFWLPDLGEIADIKDGVG